MAVHLFVLGSLTKYFIKRVQRAHILLVIFIQLDDCLVLAVEPDVRITGMVNSMKID